ncbi:NIPA-like protein 2 [Tubulanus polymorphus]|uniref:NIPA-like protein 2 n=1 Tax=Tubulanus polymorphus TaxID=672921 RepID=UPI003DA6A4A5
MSQAVLTDEYHRQQDLLVGSLLSICGNLLISISLNLQKYSHSKNEKKDIKDQKHYTRDPFWWLGLLLMVLGELGNFSAYGFAPASLVAPLGTVTVIANMFLAAIFLKEKIRPEDLFGCGLAILGAFLVVAFSSKKDRVFDSSEIIDALTRVPFITYLCMEIAVLILLFLLMYKFKVENVLVYLLICCLFASFTVISAKASSSLLQLTLAGHNQMKSPVIYVAFVIMILTALIQLKYLNQAMKSFASTVVVPTHFVFFTISAIVAGIIFYREFWGLSGIDIFMFLFGCLMCFIGVHFITAGRHGDDIPDIGVATQKILADSSPTWLLTSVNKAPVQPVNTLSGTGRHPILADDSDDEILQPPAPQSKRGSRVSADGDKIIIHRYGANDSTSSDE